MIATSKRVVHQAYDDAVPCTLRLRIVTNRSAGQRLKFIGLSGGLRSIVVVARRGDIAAFLTKTPKYSSLYDHA